VYSGSSATVSVYRQPMSRRVIGLDAGGTKLLAGVVDESGSVLHRSVHAWPPQVTLGDVQAVFAQAIGAAREAAEVDAIGVGLPANMDFESGVVASSRHLPIAGFAFRDWLAGETGLPVFVDNDSTLALLAEARDGAARGARDAVMLTIGTGIGGGLMSAGRLVRGARGAAGEPGHMTIDADGPPCPGDCPGRGCLEAYVSGPALARTGWPSAEAAVEAARGGDADASAALERMGENLGIGLASLLNLLDPEIIVIGGGLGANAGRLLLDPAEQVARARSLEPASSRTRFAVAQLGDDAGMRGAALLALAGGDA
jgi:glucokinase